MIWEINHIIADMKRTMTILSCLMSAAVAGAAHYTELTTPWCDAANRVIYDGKGNFSVQSPASTSLELTIDLNALESYVNSNDYRSGGSLLLWDDDVVDYGLADVAVGQADGKRKGQITGYWNGAVWTKRGVIDSEVLRRYAVDGKVKLTITNCPQAGVQVRAGDEVLYSAPDLRASTNKVTQGYRVNLNYVSAVSLHTPSTLDTSTYRPPADYSAPFVSRQEGGRSVGRIMFLGDSITHGVNDQTWRWQLFKILVDNEVEAEIVGPRSGYTPGYTRLTTSDAGTSYRGQGFPNVHLAQSSGRTHNIISGSNAGMTGVNYGGHSTESAAAAYDCDTWCCLMGTNDLLSDPGYSSEEFAGKMQRMLGGRVSCRNGRYSWSPTGGGGNLHRIVDDVLRQPTDVLYVMSVPCWGRHANNNSADRHLAVRQYNNLLRQWVEHCAKESGRKIRFVDVNRGMVDPADPTPFTWPDSMSNRPGRDGLHPNERGSMIIAANLATAMGIGGRSAGLPRSSAAEWNGSDEGGRLRKGRSVSRAKGVFSADRGYSVEFSATFGNGERDTWRPHAESLHITLGDGEQSGTLRLSEGAVLWGDTILYCRDNSTEQGRFRLVWHKGSPEHNVPRGYYVWLDEHLIGQGLAPVKGSGADGLRVTADGASATLKDLRWTEGAFAPAAE